MQTGQFINEPDVSKVIPLCFTPRVFELWRGSAVGTIERKREHVCRDCLPSYQLRMKNVGRCEHPETGFSFEEGAIVGVPA